MGNCSCIGSRSAGKKLDKPKSLETDNIELVAQHTNATHDDVDVDVCAQQGHSLFEREDTDEVPEYGESPDIEGPQSDATVPGEPLLENFVIICRPESTESVAHPGKEPQHTEKHLSEEQFLSRPSDKENVTAPGPSQTVTSDTATGGSPVKPPCVICRQESTESFVLPTRTFDPVPQQTRKLFSFPRNDKENVTAPDRFGEATYNTSTAGGPVTPAENDNLHESSLVLPHMDQARRHGTLFWQTIQHQQEERNSMNISIRPAPTVIQIEAETDETIPKVLASQPTAQESPERLWLPHWRSEARVMAEVSQTTDSLVSSASETPESDQALAGEQFQHPSKLHRLSVARVNSAWC